MAGKTIVRELAAKFGIDFDSGALSEGAKKLDNFVGGVQKLGAVVLTGTIVTGLAVFAQEMAEVGAELHNSAAALGMNETELKSWRATAASVGVEAEQLKGVFVALTNNVQAATQAGSEQAKLFKRLGVDVKDAAGNTRPLNDLLYDTGAALAAIQNPTERAALATRLLGEQGSRLLPAFADGAEGVRRMRQETRALYGGDLQKLGSSSIKFNAQLARMSAGFDSIRTRLAVYLLPKLTALAKMAADLVVGFQNLTRGTHVLEIAGVALGAVLTALAIKSAMTAAAFLAPWAPAIAIGALIVAGIAAIILIVDDLIALFTGGESVIGEFIDTIFGVGSAEAVVKQAKEDWASFMTTIGEVWDQFKAFVAWLTAAWDDPEATFNEFSQSVIDAFGMMLDAVGDFFAELTSGWEGAKSALGRLAGILGFDAVQANPEAQRRAGFPGAPGAGAVTAQGPTAVTSNRTNNVGQIVVQGTSDPEETARRVRDVIARDHEEERIAARAALVPTVD